MLFIFTSLSVSLLCFIFLASCDRCSLFYHLCLLMCFVVVFVLLFFGGRGVREGGGASLSFALFFDSYAKMLKSTKCVHGKIFWGKILFLRILFYPLSFFFILIFPLSYVLIEICLLRWPFSSETFLPDITVPVDWA